MLDIKTALELIKNKAPEIERLRREEDGSFYDVWKINVEQKYILKKTVKKEVTAYKEYLSTLSRGVPTLIDCDSNHILLSFEEGKSLLKADRESIRKTLDTLIYIQDKYWNIEKDKKMGICYEKCLKSRINRKKFLLDQELEEGYQKFLDCYEKMTCTFCHDDLLPFNVVVNDNEAVIIDWIDYGMLPYLTSFARLIAHSLEEKDAFFFMKDEDKKFAIEYYYERLLKDKGIGRDEYLKDLNLFLFYEYTEWIMVGNKYNTQNSDRFIHYTKLAKQLLPLIK